MKYNVGDKVRVINNIHSHNFGIGEIVTITQVFDVDYEAKNNDDYWLVTDNEIELVEEKQPEQVLKEQVQQIADENEQNCGNCKKCNTDYDCPSKCKDFDKWEADEPCNTNQIVEDYSDKIKESLEPSQLANKLKTTQLEKYKSLDKVEKFKLLQEEELELYKIKNAKYGDSFGISVHKYGLISALTRMSDKWNRIENLILNHEDGTDDESLIDSLRDLSNYANMTIIELEDME